MFRLKINVGEIEKSNKSRMDNQVDTGHKRHRTKAQQHRVMMDHHSHKCIMFRLKINVGEIEKY